MHAVLEELRKIGIIPVIKIDDAGKAVPLARALIAGGIPCAEVTFRTAQGEEAMARINREVPGILLGAGTVLSTVQVDKAIAAGAKFIVSPGFNPKVVSYCKEKGIPITPGCSGPTDIEQALEMGLEAVKFFPAEQAGGLEYIKAVAAPYSSMYFVPTGGINAQNIVKYIAYEKILACGGSWMVNADLINAGEFDKITALCREAQINMLGFEMHHIGINADNEDAAAKAADRFSALFGFKNTIRDSSVLSGSGIEIMKSPYLGKHGHIAIGTNSVLRARAYFERAGVEFNAESEKLDAKGNPLAIYFKEEIGGFAVHLVQKK
uniref:2-dehydro-3-deoxy-phosphogluconate aldolase n=1 Tax=uncultured bacterium contig00014 TaxID=1181505 RepID=A0A806K0U1_9BACT|nr:4-hydroxy-2-oxoglutarate aldolase/2-dehydro-3-deoxyphosphogluconate aldolase [uncultured bacterium contig00014]